MIDEYTRVLKVVAESGDTEASDLAVKKLVVHLKNVGRIKLLSKIVRELRKINAYREVHQPKVEVASTKEIDSALSAAVAAGIPAKKAVLNPSLIRGWRGRNGEKLIDRSAKRVLIDIYKKAIV